MAHSLLSQVHCPVPYTLVYPSCQVPCTYRPCCHRAVNVQVHHGSGLGGSTLRKVALLRHGKREETRRVLFFHGKREETRRVVALSPREAGDDAQSCSSLPGLRETTRRVALLYPRIPEGHAQSYSLLPEDTGKTRAELLLSFLDRWGDPQSCYSLFPGPVGRPAELSFSLSRVLGRRARWRRKEGLRMGGSRRPTRLKAGIATVPERIK